MSLDRLSAAFDKLGEQIDEMKQLLKIDDASAGSAVVRVDSVEVTLTMTQSQAQAVATQLDLGTRICMCQFGEIEYLARLGGIKHREARELNQLEQKRLETVMRELADIFGFTPNSSFGIGSKHVSKDAHRGYEVKKVLEKALAEWHEPNPKGLRGVAYDGLTVRYTDDPAPVAKVKD